MTRLNHPRLLRLFQEKFGALGPYIDYFLLAGALVAAVAGVRSQGEVAASTADYKTLSAEDHSRHVAPALLPLFAMNDRAVRMQLLQRIDEVGHRATHIHIFCKFEMTHISMSFERIHRQI